MHAPIKPHDDVKKNFGPQSLAALTWTGGAKNPRVKDSYGESGKTDCSKIWKLECRQYMWQRNGGVRRTEKAKGGCMLFAGSEMRGEGACFFGVKGRRHILWWCGNDDKIGGVGILVKEELCEKVVEVRRRCDRVMAIGLVFEEEVVSVICAYAPQSGKPDAEERFYEEWHVNGACQTKMNWRWDWEISMAILGNVRKDLKVYMEGME